MVYKQVPAHKWGNMNIKFKGEFVLDEVDNAIKSWLKEHKLKYYETLYKDKDGDFDVRNIEIKLYAKHKVTEYYKHVLNIFIKADNYVEKTIIVDNKKQIKGRGKIRIKIKGDVLADYKDLFKVKGKPLVEAFYKELAGLLFYVRKLEVMKREIDYLRDEIKDLALVIRKTLNLESTI